MATPQQPPLHHLDIEGSLIPEGKLVVDKYGNCYDRSKLGRTDLGQWYYNGKLLPSELQDASGTGVVQSTNAPFNTEDWRSSSSEETDSDLAPTTLTTASLIQDRTTKPRTRRVLFPDHIRHNPYVREVKMANLNVNNVPESLRIPDVKFLNSDIDVDRHFRGMAGAFINFADVAPANKLGTFGYIAEDLLSHNALYCQPCRPSSLERPSLKIFRPENFFDVPQDVYEAIIPALALAEKLILQGNPHFFVSLVCGERVIDRELSIKKKSIAQRLRPVSQATPENMQSLVECLENMGSRLEWRFEDLQGCYGMTYGAIQTSLSLGKESFNRRFGDPLTRPITIYMVKDFSHVARSYARLTYPDEAAKLRFMFFFAKVVCHELSHAIERENLDLWWLTFRSNYRAQRAVHDRARNRTRTRMPGWFTDHPDESYWDNEIEAEMGARFEVLTFGGRIAPTDGFVHAKMGLSVANRDGFFRAGQNYGARAVEGKVNGVAIPMGFIEEIQQASFWSRDPTHRPSLRILIGGLTSRTLPYVTTADWRKHELEQMRAEDQCKREIFAPKGVRVHDLDDTDTVEPVPKRPRIFEPSASTPGTTSRIIMPKRRLQPNIRRYMTRAALDEAEMRAKMIQDAIDEEQQVATARNSELAEAESRRQYRAPPADQHAIHDFLRYEDESSSSESDESDHIHDITKPDYDALQIPANRLRISDKWILAEEYASLTLGWEPTTFLTARNAGETDKIIVQYNPRDPRSWSQRELDELAELRKQHPERSWTVLRLERREERRRRRAAATLVGEMEELITLSGYSRIQFHQLMATGKPLPLGVTISNFESEFRPRLNALRQQYNVDALGQLQPIPPSAQVLTANMTAVTRTSEWLQVLVDSQNNKITNYTLPALEVEALNEKLREAARQRHLAEQETRRQASLASFTQFAHEVVHGDEILDASGVVRSRQRSRTITDLTRRLSLSSLNPSVGDGAVVDPETTNLGLFEAVDQHEKEQEAAEEKARLAKSIARRMSL